MKNLTISLICMTLTVLYANIQCSNNEDCTENRISKKPRIQTNYSTTSEKINGMHSELAVLTAYHTALLTAIPINQKKIIISAQRLEIYKQLEDAIVNKNQSDEDALLRCIYALNQIEKHL